MTTTLRPTGPEDPVRDGERSRSYDVCDNGRPVGALRLSARRTGPGGGPAGEPTGTIDLLEIEPAQRRRGRASVAVLAAEEVLRSWGCVRSEVRVPAEARAALGLAGALGYAEHSRTLVKELRADRASAPGCSRTAAAPGAGTGEVRPLTPAEYRGWRTRAGAAPGTGIAAEPDAHAVLRALVHRGSAVGALWLVVPGGEHGAAGAQSGGGASAPAAVRCVQVAAGHRGRGHGRTLLLVAERECRAAGQRLLSFEVAAENTPTLGLCDALGYRTIRYRLGKPLR